MSSFKPTSAIESNRSGGTVHVLGGGHVATALATRLAATGEEVHIVDRAVPSGLPDGVTAEAAASLDGTALDDASLHDASTAVVVDRSDATNLLLSRLARARFDVDRVLTLLHDPALAGTYDDVEVELVASPTVLGRAIFDRW